MWFFLKFKIYLNPLLAETQDDTEVEECVVDDVQITVTEIDSLSQSDIPLDGNKMIVFLKSIMSTLHFNYVRIK